MSTKLFIGDKEEEMLDTVEKEHEEVVTPQRYWVRGYDAKESIRQIKRCENRKLESKVECGLELCRAKFNMSWRMVSLPLEMRHESSNSITPKTTGHRVLAVAGNITERQ